jgi:cbb3-type cytochrome oxidase maturation protein
LNIPPPVLLLLGASVTGAALALAAFVWAVRKGQLDPDSSGARTVFLDEENSPR